MVRTTLKKEKVDCTTPRGTARPGSAGVRSSTSCRAGPTRRRRRGAPVRHGPGAGAGTHLPPLPRPFPNRVCLPRRQAAPGPQRRLGPFPGQTAFSFQHGFCGLLLGAPAGLAPGGGSLRPFSLRNLKRHIFEEEIHRRMGTRSARGRHASNSKAGRRIPPERLWLRVPPLAAGPAPDGSRTASGLKTCLNRSLFETNAATRDWAVRHSLGLARWVYECCGKGKIDSVMLVPTEGSVCLEDKGGRVFYQFDGWQTADHNQNRVPVEGEAVSSGQKRYDFHTKFAHVTR